MAAVLTNFTATAFAEFHEESSGGSDGPPTVTGLTPSIAGVGDPDLTVCVDGTGFIDGESTVVFDGAEVPTTFVSPRALTIVVSPGAVEQPHIVTVTVTGAEGDARFSFVVTEVPTGTSAEILAWVQGQSARAQSAREIEQSNESPRSTLLTALDKIINANAS